MSLEKPLSDVRVISMGQVVAGPLCSALLADLGADVVKVESPDGDSIRGTSRELDGEPFSVLYEQYNRNKRSVCLDVKADRGRAVLYELIADADVFVQNFGPDVVDRLELDAETLEEHNENLLYVSISGYGEEGPLSDRPSFDTLVQHAAGFASLQGFDGDRPKSVRCHVADYFAGYNAAVSVLAALYHRSNGGRGGQTAEISMFQSLIHNTNAYFELYNNVGELPEKPSRGESSDVMYGTEPVEDGWIAVAFLATFPNIWEGFCELVDRPELLDEPKYATPADRADEETRTEIYELLREWLAERTADEAVRLLNEHGIPAAHHRTIPEVTELDHVAERETFVEFDHPQFGSIELTNTPLDLSETPPSIDSHSPALGEHTDEVLAEVGYSEGAISELREQGVLPAPR